MSAISTLYMGTEELPLWTKYQDGEMTLFESNYLVPIFWMSLFTEENFVVWLDPEGESDDLDDNRVPTLIRIKEKCINSIKERSEFIKDVFQGSHKYIDDFALSLEKSSGTIVSIDMSELFYFVEDQEEFFEDIQNALRFFDNKDKSKMKAVLRLADIQKYDSEICDIIPNRDLEYSYHFLGRSQG